MRLLFISCFLLCCSASFAQPKVRYHDHFDFDSSYDPYSQVYDALQEENIKGKVKELKKISDRIMLHLKLNKKGEIIEYLEYADSARLSHVKTFTNRRLIREESYNRDGTATYTFYEYNRAGQLISKTYSGDKKNKRQIGAVTSVYNDEGQILSRKYGPRKEYKFIYDGDSIEWNLITKYDTLLNSNAIISVFRRIRKQGYEGITYYKPGTRSSGDFRTGIIPIRGYEWNFDAHGNVIGNVTYEYDSTGSKVLTIVEKHEYEGGLLVKSNWIYNTDWLKAPVSDEYSYTGNALLQSKIHKHGNRIDSAEYKYDKQGNVIFDSGSTFRYFYDKYGNWVLKQKFHKAKSSYSKTRGGVTKAKKFNEDTWMTEERREISFF